MPFVLPKVRYLRLTSASLKKHGFLIIRKHDQTKKQTPDACVGPPLEKPSFFRSEESANLDFLRSVAVLCVFFSHLPNFLISKSTEFLWHLGILGVLMFFVHTSLVLMMSLERSQTEGVSLFKNFYIRRLFRIYPLSAACVLIVFATHLNLHQSTIYRLWTWKELVSNLLLVQNLFYVKDMIFVLWSLPIEVQMYFFLPFLFLLAGRCSIPTLYVIWFATVIVGIVQPHVSGRLNVLSYAPCFLPGVIAWRMIPRCAVKLPGSLWPLALAASTVVWWFSDRQHSMYFQWAFCVLLGATIPLFAEHSFQPLKAISKTVAKYSYGIYLSHLFSMTIAFMLIRNRFAQWSAFCILSFVLPYVMYHLIENPGIRLGKTVASRWSRRKITIEVPPISERQLTL